MAATKVRPSDRRAGRSMSCKKGGPAGGLSLTFNVCADEGQVLPWPCSDSTLCIRFGCACLSAKTPRRCRSPMHTGNPAVLPAAADMWPALGALQRHGLCCSYCGMPASILCVGRPAHLRRRAVWHDRQDPKSGSGKHTPARYAPCAAQAQYASAGST